MCNIWLSSRTMQYTYFFFGILLKVNICNSMPKLGELVELVKLKKLEKLQGSHLHLGWPGKSKSNLISMSYYLWVGPTALLAFALLKALEWYSQWNRAADRIARKTNDSTRNTLPSIVKEIDDRKSAGPNFLVEASKESLNNEFGMLRAKLIYTKPM